WDLESAIDHLDALGWVDTNRVGSMGWSQGGYISAFAGLHSDRFAAVSVGAGVSDWYTYAISNDVPDFTRDFLGVELFGEDRSSSTAARTGVCRSRTRWSSTEGCASGVCPSRCSSIPSSSIPSPNLARTSPSCTRTTPGSATGSSARNWTWSPRTPNRTNPEGSPCRRCPEISGECARGDLNPHAHKDTAT